MAHPLLANDAGRVELLLGNEAIVRGALEAGVRMVTCYPGTPSSEAPDTFFRLAPEASYDFEYSVNEKVALEVGGGAALAGALTLTTMKHVGVNVAADPLMTLAYTGTPGGLVVLSADDPGCHSSQNEQDNRYYARLAGMPCFEPASAQEAKDMTAAALALSREWEQPVLLRTTTRLNHLRGPVEFKELPPAAQVDVPAKNWQRFVPIPAVARVRHEALVKNLGEIAFYAETTDWITESGQGEVGIVATGMSRAFVGDVLEDAGLTGKVRLLELGMTWPLPEKRLTDFMESVSRLLVLEEGEPLLEKDLRALAQKSGTQVAVFGKDLPSLGPLGEYDTTGVRRAVDMVMDRTPEPRPHCEPEEGLPMRPPNLCPGCPHRATYYAVRQVFGDSAHYSSDIGCYTLGILPPLSAADFLLCMGSSVSAGSGFSRASGRPVVGFIGDSTFFHSGVTGLINAVFNRHDILLVILDNSTTAMTGHQPHPGVETTVHGENPSRVDIEAIVRGCGVDMVRTVSPSNLKKTMAAVEELKQTDGVRVLIAKEPCPLHARRLMGKTFPKVARVENQTPAVRECLETLACPAFHARGEEIHIDQSLCTGCMVCLQITSDIKAASRSRT
jgi:indolepyruvate ferredoxin oxidoreductase alpha subunit